MQEGTVSDMHKQYLMERQNLFFYIIVDGNYQKSTMPCDELSQKVGEYMMEYECSVWEALKVIEPKVADAWIQFPNSMKVLYTDNSDEIPDLETKIKELNGAAGTLYDYEDIKLQKGYELKEGTLADLDEIYEKKSQDLFFILLKDSTQYERMKDVLYNIIDYCNVAGPYPGGEISEAEAAEIESEFVYPGELQIIYSEDIKEISDLEKIAKHRGLDATVFNYYSVFIKPHQEAIK